MRRNFFVRLEAHRCGWESVAAQGLLDEYLQGDLSLRFVRGGMGRRELLRQFNSSMTMTPIGQRPRVNFVHDPAGKGGGHERSLRSQIVILTVLFTVTGEAEDAAAAAHAVGAQPWARNQSIAERRA